MRFWLALALVGCQSVSATTPMDTCGKLGGCEPPHVSVRTTDKVDLLFMIDNSSSMADKEELLAQAVPDLVDRLLLPNCVLASDPSQIVSRNRDGTCPDDARREFEPVRDIHLGIVSSSLGGGGATDICDPGPAFCGDGPPPCFPRNADDKAHLVNRQPFDAWSGSSDQAPLSDALPGNDLAWMPAGDRDRLIADFQTLVRGVGEFGCGLEAQMEAWYRFLVQPDPWDAIRLDTAQSPPGAVLVGVDQTILQQRHDFLRPDSALAVIVVTDEEDSWSDPMWLHGRGWITRAQNNTFSTAGRLPRGTSACSNPVDPNNPTATGPNDPGCRWCAFKGTETDPNCGTNEGLYGPNEDGLNVRYTNDMKRRYGMDPQFPVQRYVDGLRSALVPDRDGEHINPDGTFSSTYVGRKNCRNPIYAGELPIDSSAELCKLKPGSRTSDQVFFMVIGGIPSDLVGADWTRILGKDPATYQSDGIDPRMIESITPRPGVADDWDTTTSKVGIDLEYACTFALAKPKDCTKLPDGFSCDCGGSYAGPLCAPNPADNGNPTLQTRAKAYPAIRELRVAKALEENAVVASICADFHPAMNALVDRLRLALDGACLPQPLVRQTDGSIPCSIYVAMPGSDQAAACPLRGFPDSRGLEQPDPTALRELGAVGPMCELVQVVPDPGSCPSCTFLGGKATCADRGAGWCYVEGSAAGPSCRQAIHLGAPPLGEITVQCRRP